MVLALENLVGVGDPNVIARVGKRILGTGLLTEVDQRRLELILERALPRGAEDDRRKGK